MRIAVVSDEHFPHTGADTEVIVNTAAALGAEGANVTLVVPRLARVRRVDDLCAFYGVRPTFDLARVRGWPAPSRSLRIEKAFHGFLSGRTRAVRDADIVHSRDLLPLLRAQLSGRRWSFETYRRHSEEKPWLPRFSRHARLWRGLGAVAHSEACRRDLVTLGFDREAVLTAPPGFSPERFATLLSRADARRKVGLPATEHIVAYVGNVQMYKGMDQLLELARRLPDVRVVVVGGSPAEVDGLFRKAEKLCVRNLLCLGHRRPAEVAPYFFAADVLFAPFLANNRLRPRLVDDVLGRVLPGTPLKLYSYLAARRPVVAADQPTNRELVRHEDTGLLFPPGRIDLASAAVRRLLSDRVLADRLATRGYETVREFTWNHRARRMLSFFERRLSAEAAG